MTPISYAIVYTIEILLHSKKFEQVITKVNYTKLCYNYLKKLVKENIMQAVGIVAEYNPFHNGHLHHLQETKKLTNLPVIAVMSASFMQRGEPAIINKWQRARLAVENGVD